ncbi:bifunctional folylpolyglutamate synthase/dihydrofolate synthase, partial [candidate division CSSED10-310 bacterium]
IVSIITPIGIDHVHWLGKTKKSIAREKAGIIHQGSDVVMAHQPPSVRKVLVDRIARTESYLVEEGIDFKIRRKKCTPQGSVFNYISSILPLPAVQISLLGRHQCKNAALAIAGVNCLRGRGYEIGSQAIRTGTATVLWPGRLQSLMILNRATSRRRQVILDGAHNLLSINAVVKSIQETFPDIAVQVILALARDKDYKRIIHSLLALSDRFVITDFASPRAMDPQELVPFFPENCTVSVQKEPIQAFKKVFTSIQADQIILMTGSLYLVGNMLATLENSREFQIL